MEIIYFFMICELAIFTSSFTFCREQHEWRQRPIDTLFGETAGHINSYVRHDHGFYSDGTNSGYFGQNKGVDSDDPKYLNKYENKIFFALRFHFSSVFMRLGGCPGSLAINQESGFFQL